MGISRNFLALSLALIASGLFAQARPGYSLQGEKQEIRQPEAEQLIALANRARAAAGAAPLKWDAALTAAARQHCLRMVVEGPISHQYAGEADVLERAHQAGAHFSLIEENVAIGPDPATIHNSWMNSPRHRANLLNPHVDRVGVSVVASRGVLYAVADYERVVPMLADAQVEAAVAGLLRASGVKNFGDVSVDRAACAMDRGLPDSHSGPQAQFIMRWQGVDLTHLPQALTNKLASGQYRSAAVGSCTPQGQEGAFTAYRLAVLLY
jgi:uncharacterized protein YkwD